jgi:hypothetical protein
MRESGGPALALPATPQIRFAPEAVVLYRSFLEPDGARHEQLAALELG